MDSVIIDGANAVPLSIVEFSANAKMENFTVLGNGTIAPAGIHTFNANIIVRNCKVTNVKYGISINRSTSLVENCFITNCYETGIDDECGPDTCHSVYSDNLILTYNASTAVYFSYGGYPTFTSNIVIDEGGTRIGVDAYTSGLAIENNLIINYQNEGIALYSMPGDTQNAVNNLVSNIPGVSSFTGGITTGTGYQTVLENNVLKECSVGIFRNNTTIVRSDYNLFWKVQQLMNGQPFVGDSNIVADPMFVNDTIPTANGSYDFHLQKYSPAIDKGDPSILDVDGSRSDIGMFGGPLGQKYTYQDLAPKPPRNLTASMDSGLVHLKWNKNTEADLFRYRVYRDTVPDFIYDTTKIIAVLSDTVFYDDPPQKFISGNYYYKITAIDSAYHQSPASEEAHINITGIPEAPPIVVEHYNLLQNYPNPFNPSTTIPYRLKAPGYVKVMVYNLLGEQVKVLVNKYQSAGYYEVLFHPTATERQSAEGKIEFETGYGDIVSGIYLYRIEVIGEGNIPVFTDMKKMMLG
ncbi:MAG: right-handed parallel beta-helix repeat-containing protein [Ignavibacteriales bacterium]|nr:right-handed parallel beta-helix repeat-containing protein [Ignavibacteriales bacterium]